MGEMNRRQFMTYARGALISALGVIGCGHRAAVMPTTAANVKAGASADRVELTISVAASVQDAMEAIQVAYRAKAPTVKITYNAGSSGSLAQQINQGAPADIFLSASPQWMANLVAQGNILNGSWVNLLQNAMVLVVPQGQVHITRFEDLKATTVAKVAIGEPETVPAGHYAREILTALNLRDRLQTKLVFAKDARQVLAYVETGNVDAGLVYATDARRSDRVQVIATAPPETHSPIIYPVAVVRGTAYPAAAQAFVDFLTTDVAAAIFRGYGFNSIA